MGDASWTRKSDGKVRTRRCNCAGQPRRRCQLCDPTRAIYLACSARCLHEHLRADHAVTGEPAAAQTDQVRAGLETLNRTRQAWDAYETHRVRLGKLLRAVQRAEGLCVLGAGNCDDLDLAMLVREFGEVHLVDLDGVALAQAVTRVPEAVRARITLHAGIDLSGTAALLDRWGERFPSSADLTQFVAETSRGIARAIGRTFDVVLSACLMSQLYLPVRESLLLGMDDWQRLFSAIERAHLATVAALAREGGTGVLALDVASSSKLPELSAFAAPETWDGLGAAMSAAIASRKVTLDPDPPRLVKALTEMSDSAERPRLLEPWVWNVGGGVLALVQPLLFGRP